MTDTPGTTTVPPFDEQDCASCEIEGQHEECKNSHRPCLHHCNHSWNHDHCHWCDAEWGENGEVTFPVAVESKEPTGHVSRSGLV